MGHGLGRPRAGELGACESPEKGFTEERSPELALEG